MKLTLRDPIVDGKLHRVEVPKSCSVADLWASIREVLGSHKKDLGPDNYRLIVGAKPMQTHGENGLPLKLYNDYAIKENSV
ncbi:MAG: hypothetical protein GY820_47755 [Gammaproteobacteria bacterium]|nr:hypothetical protein [Gammaproteobacteria bacterium]